MFSLGVTLGVTRESELRKPFISKGLVTQFNRGIPISKSNTIRQRPKDPKLGAHFV